MRLVSKGSGRSMVRGLIDCDPQIGIWIAHVVGEAVKRGIQVVEVTREAEEEWVKEILKRSTRNVEYFENCTWVFCLLILAFSPRSRFLSFLQSWLLQCTWRRPRIQADKC